LDRHSRKSREERSPKCDGSKVRTLDRWGRAGKDQRGTPAFRAVRRRRRSGRSPRAAGRGVRIPVGPARV